MKFFSFAAFFVVFFSLSTSVFAQNPSPTPLPDDEVLKISTTLIQLDVTVTGKNGKIVTDLKPEDFEVYENGRKQDITNFSFVSLDSQTKPPETVDPPSSKNNKNSIPIPPVKLKAEQVRRTYALVVDDLGLGFSSIFEVRQSLRKFVNEQMQDGDLVAIIRTGSGIGALQSFTSDKRQLLAAINKIKWNSYGRSGISVFEPIREGSNSRIQSDGKTDDDFQQQISDFRNENFSGGTLGALSYIIRGMQGLPGRKAVMLFSEGFPLTPHNFSSGLLNQIRVLADMANRSSVVIYPLDPRGLQVPGMFYASDVVSNVFPGSRANRLRAARDAGFLNSQQSLLYLASETGGIAYLNQNKLTKGLERALDDQRGYYLLGYQPDEETFDPKKNKFNKLEIKLKRRGLKVRYRSGFFSVTDEKLETVAQTPERKVINALISPFGGADINLSLYPVYQNDAANGDVIQALVYIDAKDLKFTQAANEKRKLNFDIVAMTFGDNGASIHQLLKNYTIEVNEKVYQNMLKNGFVYALPVPIKKFGAYQFRIAVRDKNSDKIGSASQFIEVPDFKKKISLSNLILDNFTPEEWQKIKLGGSRDDGERSVLLDTTLRRFKSGTVLRYDYMVYNPKQSRQITTHLRLISDGKVVYEENPSPLAIEGQPDLTRIQASGAITLGKNLAPGSYILQAIATDKTAKEKSQIAAQFVEFEITE